MQHTDTKHPIHNLITSHENFFAMKIMLKYDCQFFSRSEQHYKLNDLNIYDCNDIIETAKRLKKSISVAI